jgi:hypothetical protein
MDDFEERMWMTTISYVDGFYLGERVSEVEWRTWVVQLGVRNAFDGVLPTWNPRYKKDGGWDEEGWRRTVVGMEKVGIRQVRRTFDQVAQLI